MAKKKVNTIDRLEVLVNELSRHEKRSFKRYVKSGKSSGDKYLVLFDELQSSRSKSDSLLAKKHFGGSIQKLQASGRYLEKLIFESLAFYKNGGCSGLNIARVAKEKGFINHSKKILLEELEQSSKDGNFHHLVVLWEEVDSLVKTYKLPLKSFTDALPSFVFQKNEALEELEIQIRIRRLYQRLKPILSKGIAERRLAFRSLEKEVHSAKPKKSLFYSEYLYLKLIVRWLSLGNKIRQASENQAKLLVLINENKGAFSFEQILEARLLCISFSIYERDFQKARGQLLGLGTMDVPNRQAEEIVTSEWARKAVFIAVGGGFVDIGKRAEKELLSSDWIKKIPSKRKVNLYFQCALLALISNDYEAILAWGERISKYRLEDWKQVSWALSCLKVIALCEMGLFLEAQKIILEYEHEKGYKKKVLSLLEKYAKYLDRQKLQINWKQEEIAFFVQDENDIFFQNIFDIRPWLLSKYLNKPLSKIIKEQNQSLSKVVNS